MSKPSPDIAIRTATAEDAVAIHELIRELAETAGSREKFRSKPSQYLRHGFSAHPMFEVLLAEKAGAIVGVILYFYTFSSWRGEPGVYIQDLVVTEAARGQGLGERLLRELVCAVRERDVTHLRLAVDCNNTSAIRFYERCGLASVESDFIFEIEGDDFLRLGGAS